MKNCTSQSGTTKRQPLGMLLLSVVAGSAAMTFSLAAVSPDSTSPRHGSSIGQTQGVDVTRSARISPEALHHQINEVMGLEKSVLQHVDVAADHPLEGVLNVVIDGEPATVTYWPHSVRSDNYRVWTQIEGGELVEVEPTPERTFRGMIDGIPGSLVVGSIHGGNLHAGFDLPDGRLLWIEPVSPHIGGADETLHILYDTDDADCDDGTCGAPHRWFNNLDGLENGPQMASGLECEIAEIAFDVDVQYYQALGSSVSNVINNVNAIVNAINSNQYEDQVGIVHEITEIVIRTSSADNPYTTNHPESLLNQFRDEWRTSPESSIPRDLAHLLTGRNLSGSVIGIAWLGTVCHAPNGFHYGLSQRLTNFTCMTDLVAHEIGHNWNAGHCSCSNSTMNAGLTCSNTFTGSGSNSIAQILNYKNSVNCLDPCEEPEPPANNTCQDRITIGDGSTNFHNEFATTEGPSESSCSFFGDPQVHRDVWYEYTATCTGELTVSLCDSSMTTKLAVYGGTTCPTSPNTVDECNVSGCDSNRSIVTLDANEGEDFIIRIGGRVDQSGTGVIDITCEEVTAPACPSDLNDDGEVDALDLLILLSDWGPCPGCGSDLNDDDEVDALDLLILLSDWGSCP